MPRYQRYRGESTSAASTRIARNKAQDMGRMRRPKKPFVTNARDIRKFQNGNKRLVTNTNPTIDIPTCMFSGPSNCAALPASTFQDRGGR